LDTGLIIKAGVYDCGMARVRLGDVAIFSRQLATMQAAGLPLVQAVAIIAEQTENSVFKAILARVAGDIQAGAGFPDALAKHPYVFPALFVNMVKAGIRGGNLDVILERISSHFEKEIIFNLNPA